MHLLKHVPLEPPPPLTGEGSLFALLKALGWASTLVAGESGVSLSSVSFFYVKVEKLEANNGPNHDLIALPPRPVTAFVDYRSS